MPLLSSRRSRKTLFHAETVVSSSSLARPATLRHITFAFACSRALAFGFGFPDGVDRGRRAGFILSEFPPISNVARHPVLTRLIFVSESPCPRHYAMHHCIHLFPLLSTIQSSHPFVHPLASWGGIQWPRRWIYARRFCMAVADQ